MSHEAAVAVVLLIPLGAALTLGKYAIPVFAGAFAVAAAGEQGGWWHAGWILGEGTLGHAIGLVAVVCYALPALLAGWALNARAPWGRSPR
jgi:hypothetical protein